MYVFTFYALYSLWFKLDRVVTRPTKMPEQNNSQVTSTLCMQINKKREFFEFTILSFIKFIFYCLPSSSIESLWLDNWKGVGA